MILNIAVAFGGLLVLAVIGFIYAWNDTPEKHPERYRRKEQS